MIKRSRIILQGVVQGVGYRPFIHRLAIKFGLTGWVMNTTQGLVIEAEGSPVQLDQFLHQATTTHPPLAHLERFSIIDIPPVGETGFVVHPSERALEKAVHIPADICVCDNCVSEMLDSNNRRYRYPFINCVNCGARFTIIRDIPYDRKQTTMQKFKMCPTCDAEYHTISHRRYHTQPNCCPVCGPQFELLDGKGKKIASPDPISDAVQRLQQGEIIAIKGIGGFHLVCDAGNASVVRRLRERKQRVAKPFAIMSGTIEAIRRYCEVSTEEEKLLLIPQRPIVLLRKKTDIKVISEAVAPNNKYLGVILPYAPLHHLLFQSLPRFIGETQFTALVMTSGNISEEPIVINNAVAKQTFLKMADSYLIHNRDIYNRCDDSIAMVVNKKPVRLRRARGYAPLPMKLPQSPRLRQDFVGQVPEILGCGGELKNTFCLTKGKFAFVSQYIGDLKTAETYSFYQETITRFEKLFRIQPEIIAFDLHPNYLSTQYALEKIMAGDKRIQGIQIQHHHAHIASCLAENGVAEKGIGIAFDGTGYGTDGNIWGCEFLIADEQSFDRVGHLDYVPLPGGDIAAEENWRMAVSYLYAIYREEMTKLPLALFKAIDEDKIRIILRMIEKKINAPLTSSAGRLFDAVSALLGICLQSSYEAQAAIELEMTVDESVTGQYGYTILENEGELIIDCRPTIEEIVAEITKKINKASIAAKFHNTVVAFSLDLCQRIRKETGLNSVALSGGTFQNRIILSRLTSKLKESGFKVYTHHQVPPNDAGISFGQVIVANAQINR
ncbi:MAG: carbamoyltransferase HypF [bacterium]|nr:carbamoyltransferase HypF [bacterium]